MKNNFYMLFVLILTLFTANFNLYAKELNTVFSYSTPPYVFKNGQGIVIEIVRESLADSNYSIKPVFVNIGRGIEMFKHGYVDANSIIKKSSKVDGYYSDYFMQYHNFAFALESSSIKINRVSDLKNYYFAAFQHATKYLGKEFENTAYLAGDRYSEIADQKQQVHMLLKGRIEIAVMDIHIFTYYKNMLIKEGKVAKDIKVKRFELFEPTKYRTVFADKKIRDEFNKGLNILKKSGRYGEIYKEYSEKFFYIQQ